MVDQALILRKMDDLEKYLLQIREFQNISVAEYSNDWKTQRIVERTFQIMIETCADVATHIISDPKNHVVFVGYQAQGTPGRDIVKYGDVPGGYVYLNGKRITIRANIHILNGYSAHADQTGLIEWVQSMSERPREIKLVHGEPQSQKALADLLEQRDYAVKNLSFRKVFSESSVALW